MKRLAPPHQSVQFLVLILVWAMPTLVPLPGVTAQNPGGQDHNSGGSRAPSPSNGRAADSVDHALLVQAVPAHLELVFMSDSGGDWDVYRWKSGTTTPLTGDPGTDWVPAGSPGGGRVAFTTKRHGNEEVYVVDYDGTNERRLTQGTGNRWYPDWSPDGKRIVYSSDQDGDHEIFVRGVDDGNWMQLTYNDVYDGEPAYCPDGRILFTSDRDGNDEIYIMNPDGTGQRNLTNNPADDYFAACSPDGVQFGFTSLRTGDEEIFQQALSGGAPVNRSNHGADDWALAWSPDGDWIVFSSNRPGDEEVYVMPAGGGALTNISQNPGTDDRWGRFLAPKVLNNSAWERAGDWTPPGVPGRNDRVLVPAGSTGTITSGENKTVMELAVAGNLTGSCDVHLSAPRGLAVGPAGRIKAGQHGTWKWGCAVALDAWPQGTITIDGAVSGGDGASKAPWDEDGGAVDLQGRKVVVNGTVEGGRGGDLQRHWRGQAGKGGSVTVGAEEIVVSAAGAVHGGQGGNTNGDFASQVDASGCPTHWQDGGDGGSVLLGSGMGAMDRRTRKLTVSGIVRGGYGGDVAGRHSSHTGRGGNVKLVVGVMLGTVDVRPGALVAGGDGGRIVGQARDCGDCCVCGGNGGSVSIFATNQVAAAGAVQGGAGGDGRAVPRCQCECGPGFEGKVDGDITLHPPSIAVTGTGQAKGQNVWIYGGEDWGIDLSSVQPGAIEAKDSIVVAVGKSGQIDLRGHASGETALKAGRGVTLYAGAGQILLDSGVAVSEVTSPPAQVSAAKVIRRPLLYAEGSTSVAAGDTARLNLLVINAGAGEDTFHLEVTDTAGWPWQVTPVSISLAAMAEDKIVAQALVPTGAVGQANEITASARSAADPQQKAEVTHRVEVVGQPPRAYLPVLLSQSHPGLVFYDGFEDPKSGWLVGDIGDAILDYADGNYRMQIERGMWFVYPRAPGVKCSDCIVQAEAWRSSSGDSRYGILFGHGGTRNFYAFLINPDKQEYFLWRYDQTKFATVIPYTHSTYIKPGSTHNLLRVVRRGAEIGLYANDQHLATTSDATYAGVREVGVVGLSWSQAPVWLRYDNFTVWGTRSASVSGVGVATGAEPATLSLEGLDLE